MRVPFNMITKATILLVALVAATSAGIAQPSSAYFQPGVKTVAVEPEPVDLNPRYDYSYSVHDGVTGDQKTHAESRDGETVQGEYSLVDPDGTLRTVRYIANEDGYNAVVTRQVGFAAPAPVVVRKVAPVAPVTYRTLARAPTVYNPAPILPVPTVYKAASFSPVAFQPVVQRPALYRASVQAPTAYKFSAQIPYGYKTFAQPKVIQKPAPVFAQYPVQHNFVTPPLVAVQRPQLVFQQQHLVQQPQPIIQQRPLPLPVEPVQPPQQDEPQQVQQPQPAPAPQPAPQPVQLPQPQPPQPPQRPTQPQPPVQAPPPQQEPAQADDSAAVVVEAASPRSAANPEPNANSASNTNNRGEGSFFTYSSKGLQYDFNVAY